MNTQLPPMVEKSLKLLSIIVLSIAVFAMHQTILICYKEVLTPPQSCTYGSAQGQLSFLFIAVLLTLFDARLRNMGAAYVNAWKQNWFVAVFVLLALLSFFWSVYLPGTIYRSLVLLSITLIGAYVGFRFSIRDLVIFVALFGGVVAAASLLLAIILPDAAIMPNPPYIGLWRGIFWHKTFLGAAMALGCMAFLVMLFSSAGQFTFTQKILALVALIACLTLAVLSDSASGLITLTVQIGLFILVLAWLRWRHLIPRRTYWILGFASIPGAIFLAFNLESILSLFNRSINLTGRVPLWSHLLETYIAKRPYLGHGFGAFWTQPDVGGKIQTILDWMYPVKIADNGYMDILLGLGATGLTLLFAMLIVAFIRTFRHALAIRDLTSFFPLIVLVHISLVNLSLSYFVEMESFIWFLLITILFMTTRFRARGSQS